MYKQRVFRLFKVDNKVLNEQIEQMIAASEEDKTRNLHEFNLSELYPTNPGIKYLLTLLSGMLFRAF